MQNNYNLQILNPNGEKKILIVGVFHGDEPQGEYFINRFLSEETLNPPSHPEQPPSHPEQPLCHPELVSGSQSPNAQEISNQVHNGKNKTTKNALYFIPRLNSENTRTNKNGVDLNRNYPTKNWQKTKRDEFFGGDTPASEDETKFMINLIKQNNFAAIITIHAPFEIVNYDGPALELATKISSIVKLSLQKDIGYETFGSFGTFCGIENNIPTITIEVDEKTSPGAVYPRFSDLFNYLGNEF